MCRTGKREQRQREQRLRERRAEEDTEGVAVINAITEAIIGAAIAVHRELGPGLLESTYEACLAHELTLRDLRVERQRPFTIRYRGKLIDHAYRVDLLVEDRVIVELKAVDHITPIHKAQLLSYLKLSRCKVGLLINFNEQLLKDGVCRLIH